MTLVHSSEGIVPTMETDFTAQILPRGSKQLLGTEIETFLVDRETLRPVDYPTHQKILQAISDAESSFERGYEHDVLTHLIGREDNKGSIVCGEPGCQMEWARRPVEDLHQATEETDRFLRLLAEEAQNNGLALAIPALYPLSRGKDIPLSGRPRYQAFQSRINAVPNGLGPDISRGTCALQTNIDTRPDTWVSTVRAAFGIQPVLTALFANSPVFAGDLTNNVSNRATIWFENWGTNTNGYRSIVMARDFSAKVFEDFIRAQELPLLGDIELPRGTTFNHLLDPATKPKELARDVTTGDFANVLGTAFAPIKIKEHGVIELRGADASFVLRHTLEALACGIFYDDKNLDRVYNLVMSWSTGEQEELAHVAPRQGLAGKFGRKNTSLQQVAAELCNVAHSGLVRRGMGEEKYLQPLLDIANGDMPSLAERTRRAIQCGMPARAVFEATLVTPGSFPSLPSHLPGQSVKAKPFSY